MVWESTLKRIEDQTAINAALKWFDKPENIKLINNQINCVYRFEHQNQGFYLRITHEKIRSFEELLAAIDFQKHLVQNNAPVCEPIPSKQDQFIEEISQGELKFLTHICKEAPGTVMNFEYSNKSVYATWGKSLAMLHRASMSYCPQNHHFISWKDLWKETYEYAQQDKQDIKAIFQEIDDWFCHHKQTNANFGLTHGDHRPGNVLYDGKQINIIDFDEPVYHWFIADIARPFLELYSQPQIEWQQKFEWYIDGYRSVLPITDHELNTLDWFIRMKILDIYLWSKNNWFEPVAPGGKLREQWLTELKNMAIWGLRIK